MKKPYITKQIHPIRLMSLTVIKFLNTKLSTIKTEAK